VVAEEVEGAVEILVRMLRTLAIPRNVIEDRVREVRTRAQPSDRAPWLGEVAAPYELSIEDALVRDGSPLIGASPVSLELRSRTGALVVAIRRGDALVESPDPRAPFAAGDVVYLVGRPESLQSALALF
jgi:CPA2 family monovalent cation:H+ antiporter-2